MKILVIGGTSGNVDVINKHLEKSSADIVLCTGDMGLLYRPGRTALPKVFRESNFYEYLEGRKKFIKPVYAVRGLHDNLSLCGHLSKEQIKVENFTLMRNGERYIHSPGVITENDKPVSIVGIGGGYSPKCFAKDKLFGSEHRYFSQKDIEKLKKNPSQILVMHDFLGQCSKKQIVFTEETYSILDTIRPFYCLLGKYHFWGKGKPSGTNVVSLPLAEEGYLLIDTRDDWDASGIRFDI